MIGNFLVLVETLQGEFVRAFTFKGRHDDAIQRGVEKAYEANQIRVNVSASPIANS